MTLRLTPARKQNLRELARRESLLGSPGDILDRSVELALRHQPKPVADLRNIEEIADALENEARVNSARLDSRLARVEEALTRLHTLIAALAESS